jgi:hypothetical protein
MQQLTSQTGAEVVDPAAVAELAVRMEAAVSDAPLPTPQANQILIIELTSV